MKINTSFNTTSNSNDFISEDSRLVDQNNILTKMSMTLIYDKCTIIPFNKDWHTIWNEDTCRNIKGTYPFHIYLRLGIIYLNKMIISISFIILYVGWILLKDVLHLDYSTLPLWCPTTVPGLPLSWSPYLHPGFLLTREPSGGKLLSSSSV